MKNYSFNWGNIPDWGLKWLEEEGINLPDTFTEEEFLEACKGKETTMAAMASAALLEKAGLVRVTIEEGEIRIHANSGKASAE